MIIGLAGLAGSGKSEVARVLIDEFGFHRVKFADPLKNMLRTLLADIGHTPADIERYVEGDLKESVVDGLHDISVTARHLMQTLGTEWGRSAVHPDLWTTLWAAKAERFDRVVVDDVRFRNEAGLIAARGGRMWRINRPGVTSGAHVSEHMAIAADLDIYNNGSLDELAENVRYLAALLVK